MANWQRKVDFSSYTEKYHNGELSVQEFAKIVAEKLKSLEKFKDIQIDCQLEDIIWGFEDLSTSDENDWAEQDFDAMLYDLYNWGDMPIDGNLSGKKACWIQMW